MLGEESSHSNLFVVVSLGLMLAIMLLVYSLGHSALLLAAGTSMGAAKKLIESKGLATATNFMRKIAAALIIAVGFYFLYR